MERGRGRPEGMIRGESRWVAEAVRGVLDPALLEVRESRPHSPEPADVPQVLPPEHGGQRRGLR
jgi:hypothetical protein